MDWGVNAYDGSLATSGRDAANKKEADEEICLKKKFFYEKKVHTYIVRQQMYRHAR